MAKKFDPSKPIKGLDIIIVTKPKKINKKKQKDEALKRLENLITTNELSSLDIKKVMDRLMDEKDLTNKSMSDYLMEEK
jgi:hypothetical protein